MPVRRLSLTLLLVAPIISSRRSSYEDLGVAGVSEWNALVGKQLLEPWDTSEQTADWDTSTEQPTGWDSSTWSIETYNPEGEGFSSWLRRKRDLNSGADDDLETAEQVLFRPTFRYKHLKKEREKHHKLQQLRRQFSHKQNSAASAAPSRKYYNTYTQSQRYISQVPTGQRLYSQAASPQSVYSQATSQKVYSQAALSQNPYSPQTSSQAVYSPQTSSQKVYSQTTLQTAYRPQTTLQNVYYPQSFPQSVYSPQTSSQSVYSPQTAPQRVYSPQSSSVQRIYSSPTSTDQRVYSPGIAPSYPPIQQSSQQYSQGFRQQRSPNY